MKIVMVFIMPSENFRLASTLTETENLCRLKMRNFCYVWRASFTMPPHLMPAEGWDLLSGPRHLASRIPDSFWSEELCDFQVRYGQGSNMLNVESSLKQGGG